MPRCRHGSSRKKPGTMRKQEGFTLVEVLVSLALLGVVLGGFLGALTTSSRATLLNDEQATAQNLAEAQMEYVRGQFYDVANNPPQYQILPDVPQGYGVTCTASRLDPEGDGPADDDGLQRIVVTVEHRSRTVATLEAYRVR